MSKKANAASHKRSNTRNSKSGSASQSALLSYDALTAGDPVERYESTTAKTVYHYCTPDTFAAILNNRTIRVSDLSKMNDHKEMAWGLDAISLSLQDQNSKLGEKYCSIVSNMLRMARAESRYLTACFSTKPDILSQWRAYANDGEGFCVGFSTAEIEKVTGRFGSVIYDQKAQNQILTEKLIKGSLLWHQCKEEDREELALYVVARLLGFACLMKNPAFSEEKEVRFTRGLIYREKPDSFVISSPGGVGSIDVKFHFRGGTIVPYADISFGTQNPISHVVMGPKNTNSEADVKAFLSYSGHPKVKVTRSSASYR